MVTHIHAKTAQDATTAPELNSASAPASESDPLDLMLERRADGGLFHTHSRDRFCGVRECVSMADASKYEANPQTRQEETPGTIRMELIISSVTIETSALRVIPEVTHDRVRHEELAIDGLAQLHYDPATKRLIIFAKGEE